MDMFARQVLLEELGIQGKEAVQDEAKVLVLSLDGINMQKTNNAMRFTAWSSAYAIVPRSCHPLYAHWFKYLSLYELGNGLSVLQWS